MAIPIARVSMAILLRLGLPVAVKAQLPQPSPTMPDMQMSKTSPMPAMNGNMARSMRPGTFIEAIEQHGSSGTSSEPNSTPIPMLMRNTGAWMLMFHGNVFINDTQQTSPRGGDKLFSTNWFMPMTMRRIGPGQLTLRAMFSLEPATVTGERYPLLFQQGETAYGKPIVDGQHPHDLFMELAALYDQKLGGKTLLTLYFAPVGDPAIGPTAYPHRTSASEDPVATLGHHQEDSTHIVDDVITLGIARGIARIEASGFHGREPDEHRWNIDQGSLDSWAMRLTLQPGKNWTGQYSFARIASPEALFPQEDQDRMTASLMYNKPVINGNWSSTALWGRTRARAASSKENSYLFESTLRFKDRNYVWTRAEDAGRSNELLHGEAPLPPGFTEQPLAHVGAYSFGYDRDVYLSSHLRSAIGSQFTIYHTGDSLASTYGIHPMGVNIFLRLRPVSTAKR